MARNQQRFGGGGVLSPDAAPNHDRVAAVSALLFICAGLATFGPMCYNNIHVSVDGSCDWGWWASTKLASTPGSVKATRVFLVLAFLNALGLLVRTCQGRRPGGRWRAATATQQMAASALFAQFFLVIALIILVASDLRVLFTNWKFIVPYNIVFHMLSVVVCAYAIWLTRRLHAQARGRPDADAGATNAAYVVELNTARANPLVVGAGGAGGAAAVKAVQHGAGAYAPSVPSAPPAPAAAVAVPVARPVAVPVGGGGGGGNGVAISEQLEGLAAMHRAGELTAEEYAAAKAKALA